MREQDVNRKLFHRAHYNILAKRIRLSLEPWMREDQKYDFTQARDNAEVLAIRGALVTFAVDLARRLQADNEEFDPVLFLNNCSPNVGLYPMGELWEEGADDNGHSIRVSAA